MKSILCILFLFFVFFNTGNAIKCYECNSEIDSWGKDTFEANETALVDCSTKDSYNDTEEYFFKHGAYSVNKTHTLCRKNYQTVGYWNRTSSRVVRMCGWLRIVANAKENRCSTTRLGRSGVIVTYCSCEQDGCNSAQSLLHKHAIQAASFLLLFIVSICQ